MKPAEEKRKRQQPEEEEKGEGKKILSKIQSKRKMLRTPGKKGVILN